MARVFKKKYTAPIPEGAVRFVHEVKRRGRLVEAQAVRYKDAEGRKAVALLTACGTRCRIESPSWYGLVRGVETLIVGDDGKPIRNKAMAEQALLDLQRRAERGVTGLADSFAAQQARPLAAHLADYEAHLLAKGDESGWVAVVCGRLGKAFAGCGFAMPRDADAAKLSSWLARQRQAGKGGAPPAGDGPFTLAEAAAALGVKPASVAPLVSRRGLQTLGQGRARRFPLATVEALLGASRRKGIGPVTSNAYLAGLKAFFRWMAKERRSPADPVAHLEPLNAAVDIRHARRALGPVELRHLLATARDSKRTFRGLDGVARFRLYALACASGFRAGGLAALTPASFSLDTVPPTVTLPARADKSRRGKVQPLPADVAELMRAHLKGKPDGKPVWPGTWARDRVAARMLRPDLADAGIPYVVEGPDGPLHADFHALRHSYLTMGGRAGIDLRTLQVLAGHSTSRLTERYTHVVMDGLAEAVGMMPSVLPAPSVPSFLLPLAADADRGPLTADDGGGGRDAQDGARRKPVRARRMRARKGN